MASSGISNKDYNAKRLNNIALKCRYRTRALVVIRAIKKHICLSDKSRQGLLVDFGAADGLGLSFIKDRAPGLRCSGVERSQELIDCKQPNVDIIKADITRLEGVFRENSVDIISCLAVLEHIACPEKAVKEAFRILNKGGIFVATSPVPAWDRLGSFLKLEKAGEHVSELTINTLERACVKSGFVVAERGLFMFAPVSFLTYLRIRVPARVQLVIDNVINKAFIFNGFFVNQYIVAKKPES